MKEIFKWMAAHPDAKLELSFAEGMGLGGYVLLDEEIAPTIKTKQVKYFDEEEKVWKTGEVIVDG